MYGTDREVGMAIKEAGLPREQLFVTSKLLASLPDVNGVGGALYSLGLACIGIGGHGTDREWVIKVAIMAGEPARRAWGE
jgi:hypothetical protein